LAINGRQPFIGNISWSKIMSEAVEADNLNTRAILFVALAICVAILLAFGAAYAMRAWQKPATSYSGPNAAFDFKVAAPSLESAPQLDRENYFAEKERLLNSWQWVDRQAGVARIPIDAAMQLMAQRSAANGGSTPEKKR
jgi:hypothetical protein